MTFLHKLQSLIDCEETSNILTKKCETGNIRKNGNERLQFKTFESNLKVIKKHDKYKYFVLKMITNNNKLKIHIKVTKET